MNIEHLPSDVRDFIAQQLAAGAFGSESELVAEALRQFRDQSILEKLNDKYGEEVVLAKLDAGLDSLERGKGITGEEVFAKLRHENAALRKSNPASS